MAQVEVSGLFFRLILQIMYKMKALARNVFHNALLYIQRYNYSPMQKLVCLVTLIPWCPLPSPKLSCDTVWVVPLDSIEAYHWASRPPNITVTRAHLVQPKI